MRVNDFLSVVGKEPFVIWEDIKGSWSYRNDWIPKNAEITKIEAIKENQFKVHINIDFETELP